MKIDKVLEAHGIGIVQLTPPVGIVTNGLVAYWNSKNIVGGGGGSWKNIAPTTAGQYDGYLYQTSVTSNGVSFNGSSSYIQLPIPVALKSVTSATFEMQFYSYGGWADLINQDGRELLWIGEREVVLSGIFDNNKYSDHKSIYANVPGKLFHLTITADLANNRITTYLRDVSAGTTISDYYTTTVGTFANGDHIWLSRSQTPFSGVLDGIRLYNRVLTQEEMTQNWSVGANLGI